MQDTGPRNISCPSDGAEVFCFCTSLQSSHPLPGLRTRGRESKWAFLSFSKGGCVFFSYPSDTVHLSRFVVSNNFLPFSHQLFIFDTRERSKCSYNCIYCASIFLISIISWTGSLFSIWTFLTLALFFLSPSLVFSSKSSTDSHHLCESSVLIENKNANIFGILL